MIYTSDGNNIHQYSKSYRTQMLSDTWDLTCIILPADGGCVKNWGVLEGSFAFRNSDCFSCQLYNKDESIFLRRCFLFSMLNITDKSLGLPVVRKLFFCLMLSIYLISNLDRAVVGKVLNRNENCTYRVNRLILLLVILKKIIRHF